MNTTSKMIQSSINGRLASLFECARNAAHIGDFQSMRALLDEIMIECEELPGAIVEMMATSKNDSA